MRGGKGAGVPLLPLLAASLDMGSAFPAVSTCTGGEASSLRSPFSPVLSLSCEFCRLLLRPSALFSGEGVISGPPGKEAHDFAFLLLEGSLPPCITLTLLQIGHLKPLALLQAFLDQVERPGEEADIGRQGGKPPPASSLEAEVPARTGPGNFRHIGLMALDACVCQVLVQGLPSLARSSTQQLDEGWEKPWCCF